MIALGCTPGMSFWRCMSMTSGRILRFLPAPGPACRTNDSASCSSFDRGAADGTSSESISASESSSPDEPCPDIRLFFLAGFCSAVCDHSGTGLNSSNCFLNLFAYSLPLTTSSASVRRSFLNRDTDASETSVRSSSLSSHAGGCFDRNVPSSLSLSEAVSGGW